MKRIRPLALLVGVAGLAAAAPLDAQEEESSNLLTKLGSRLTFVRKSQESASTMVSELLASWDAAEPPVEVKQNDKHSASGGRP